jgi:hypothetical protein
LQDGPGAAALFGVLGGIAGDGANLYVADPDNHAIRRLSPVPTNTNATDYLKADFSSQTAMLASTTGASLSTQVGYARLNVGNTTAQGQAILDYVSNGIAISETAVPATSPLLHGRLPAEVDGPLILAGLSSTRTLRR